jgi:putative ABC transport system permease protein
VILAHPLSTSVSDFTRKFAGVSVTVHASATALIFGAVVGAVVGAGAAWIPARRATRLDVSAELSMRELAEERAPRARTRRAVLAALVALGGILLSWLANRNGSLQPWQARAAPFAAVITSVGLLLTIGALASVLASALRGAVRSNGTTALGVANLVRDPGRTGVMAIAIGAAIGTAFLVASSHQSIHDAIAQGVSTGNPREVRVATLSPNNTINVDAKPSAQLIARLARVPGVAAVDRGISLVTGHAERDLIGVTAFDQPWLNDTMLRGRKDPVSFEQGHVLVGAALARDQHLRPGSRVRLDTPTGYAWVSVGGVWADGNFNGRVVDMPMTLFQRLFGNQPPDGVGLIAAPDTPPDVLAARIVAAHLDPYVSVDTPAQLTSRLTRDISRQLAPFDALQRGLLLVAFIAVLSTLLLVGVQRRRELALLAAVGMEPGQLGRMTLAEALAVACIGLVASIVGAVGMNVAFTFIVPILVGYRDPMRFDFGSLAVWAPVAVLVVMAAALLPAWRTSRVEVLAGLQYE